VAAGTASLANPKAAEVLLVSNTGRGIEGQSNGGDGVFGSTQGKDRSGVTGINTGGGRGLTAIGSSAGHFDGDIEVTGNINAPQLANIASFITFTAGGRFKRIFEIKFDHPNLSDLNSDSIVMASLTEVDSNFVPVLGKVTMKVYNVVPGPGFVKVRGEIDSGDDVHIRASVLVVNPRRPS